MSTKDLNFLTIIKSLNLNVILVLTIILALSLSLWQSDLFLSNYEDTVALGKYQAENTKPAVSGVGYPISIFGDFQSTNNPTFLSSAQFQNSAHSSLPI